MFVRGLYWYSEPNVDSSQFLQRQIDRSRLTVTSLKTPSLQHPLIVSIIPSLSLKYFRCLQCMLERYFLETPWTHVV